MKRLRRGMSMIEAVVAVTLLGTGIAACVACIGSSTRASARAEEYTAIQLLAREKLSEIETSGVMAGEDTGDFGEERPGYHWRTLATSSDTPGLQQVRLTLAWGDEEHPHTAEFVTYASDRSRRISTPAAATDSCGKCHSAGDLASKSLKGAAKGLQGK